MEYSPFSVQFSSKSRKLSRGKCCVPLCDSNKQTNLDLSFHFIPKKGSKSITRENLFGKTEQVDQHDEWIRLLNLNVKNIKKGSFVCSKYFMPDDYYFLGKFISQNLFYISFYVYIHAIYTQSYLALTCLLNRCLCDKQKIEE